MPYTRRLFRLDLDSRLSSLSIIFCSFIMSCRVLFASMLHSSTSSVRVNTASILSFCSPTSGIIFASFWFMSSLNSVSSFHLGSDVLFERFQVHFQLSKLACDVAIVLASVSWSFPFSSRFISLPCPSGIFFVLCFSYPSAHCQQPYVSLRLIVEFWRSLLCC